MATELTVQSERAFQKQPHIFLNHRGQKAKSTKHKGKGGRRWYKDVGLGFRTPKTAIEGSYIGANKVDLLLTISLLISSFQTRNALSLAWFQFAVVSSLALSSQLRCTVPLLSVENTCISFPNTQDTRNATRTWPRMSLQLSVSMKGIL